MAGGIFLTCWHSDAVSGINILININSGTGIKKNSWVILMLAMKKDNMLTLSLHDISQYLNLTLSSNPIPFSSGPHFVRTLNHDPSVLGGPTRHSSSFIELEQGCDP